MTLPPAGVKVHLAFGYTDMRKGTYAWANPTTACRSCRSVLTRPRPKAECGRKLAKNRRWKSPTGKV
jgi:hypothetical protein